MDILNAAEQLLDKEITVDSLVNIGYVIGNILCIGSDKEIIAKSMGLIQKMKQRLAHIAEADKSKVCLEFNKNLG